MIFRRLFTQRFDPQRSSDLKGWRLRALDGVLRGIFIFWVVGCGAGIYNVLTEYSQTPKYAIHFWVATGTISVYVGVTVLIAFITFNHKLSYPMRAGTLLFVLYVLGSVGILLSSFSGDGRIFLFAFVILSAMFFDLRFSLSAVGLMLLTLIAIGLIHTGVVAIPYVEQFEAELPQTWFSGGIVLFVLSIATVISITYLLRAFEKSLDNSHKLLDREQNLALNLRVLSDINQLIVREQDKEKLLADACKRLVEAHGFTNVWVGLLSQDELSINLTASAGDAVDMSVFPIRLDRDATTQSCVVQAIASKSYVYVDTFKKFDSCLTCPRRNLCPERSALALPLVREDRRLGILVAEHERFHNAFSEENIKPFQELADDLAYALEKLEVDANLKTYARYQTLLNDVTQTAIETPDLNTMVDTFMNKLEQTLGANEYYFALWNEEKQEPENFIFSEGLRKIFSNDIEIQLTDKFFTRSILEQERVLAVEDVMNTPYISPRIAAMFAGIRSALGMPLIADGRKIGALIMGFRETYTFSMEEIKLAEQAARHFALALSKAKLNDETRAKAAELEILYSAAKDMTSSLIDTPALLETIARHMANALNVTSANIVSVGRNGDSMTVVAEYWGENATPAERHSDMGKDFPNSEYTTIISAMMNGEVLIIHEDGSEITPAERKQFETYHVKSMMFIPILSRGNLLGTIELWESRYRREFTLSEIRLAQAIANHAAAIFDNSTLFAQTRKQESELRALLAVSRAVSSSLQLSDVLRQAASTLARLMRVDFCSLSDYFPERNEIVTIALFSADHDVSGQGDLGRVFSLGEYPATLHVLQMGQPLVNRLDDPKADPSELRQLRRDEMFSSLLIPLRLRGQSLGLAELFTSDPNRVFLPDEIQFASALADQVAVAIENARLYEKLEAREAYFRALFENSADGLAILDSQGTVRYIAPTEERLTGYTPKEIIGQSAFQFMHREDIPKVLSVFREGVSIPGAVRSVQYRLKRKDGEWRRFEITGHNMLDDPLIAGVVVNYRDVTERIAAEEALKDSEERYRTIFESSGVPIWEDDYSALMKAIDELRQQGVSDFQTYLNDHPEFLRSAEKLIKIIDVNYAVVQMMEAKDKSEVLGALGDVLRNNQSAQFAQDIIALADGKTHIEHESILYTLRGDRRDVWVSLTIVPIGAIYRRVLVSTIDITERKQVERSLQENQARLAGIINTAPNGIITIDTSQKIVLFNPFAESIFGCSAEYAIGKSLDIFIPERFRFFHSDNVNRYSKTKLSSRSHGRLDNLYGLRTNGEEFPMEAFISQHTIGEERFFTVILRDITERKFAEEALKESERKFRALAENIPSTVYTCLNDGRYTMLYLNDSVEALTGYSKEEFLEQGMSFYDLYHPDDLSSIPYSVLNAGTNKGSFHITYRIRHKNGDWRWVDEWGTGMMDVNGNIQYLEGVMIDITERKQSEEIMRRRAEELQSLVIVSSALRTSLNVSEIIPLVVRYAVQIVNGAFGTIYRLEESTGNLVSPGWFSVEQGEDIKMSSDISLRHVDGMGITGHVFKTGQVHFTEDIHNDPLAYILPDETGILQEARSGISLPLLSQEKVIGVLHVRLRERHVFSETEIRLLTAIAEMAGSAIHRAALHEQTLRQADELAQAYDNTLVGWARALELRDELTEGHTRRVTELTIELAHALNIPEEQIIHIRRGAILHDIGKMGIPDSILHKSGPLTAHEQRIMQMHPQYAYEMLSIIPFLHPSLDIPYCHHEHWDGNGYPRGLKGEDIPLSARIFSVVDVWDALTSDRPYRSAWTKEKARDYLLNGYGKQFDPRIVDKFLTMIAGRL